MGREVEDDSAVRDALARELERLRGATPHQALGVPAGADPAQVRARFLELVKAHHPNRFARRAPDVVRLANEVFLRYRRAYEEAGRPGQGQAGRAQSGRAVTERLEKLDRLAPANQPIRELDAALARRRRARSYPAMPAVPAAAGKAPRPAMAPAAPSSDATPPPATASGERRITAGMPVLTAAALDERARAREEDRRERLRRAHADLGAGRLAEARELLRALLADAPADRAVRALVHYVAGREHHAAGREAEARAEYDRALRFDPSLDEARASLALLDGERSSRGGLLSRWFRK
ncbi:MAG TPA: J domain-containing protein [Kofleriaceae bacterium]|nr:J domain-containing protein [Kofleriaceae bacterium]